MFSGEARVAGGVLPVVFALALILPFFGAFNSLHPILSPQFSKIFFADGTIGEQLAVTGSETQNPSFAN